MSCTCALMQALETKQVYSRGQWTVCPLCGFWYSSTDEYCPYCNIRISGDQSLTYFTNPHESDEVGEENIPQEIHCEQESVS